MSKVPNMLTGLVPLDLLVVKPPVVVSQNLGGASYQVETPETHVGIVAKQPVAFEMTMDQYSDMVVALVLPLVLAMLTLPFTLLRLLLLGWDCNLTRNQVGTILHQAILRSGKRKERPERVLDKAGVFSLFSVASPEWSHSQRLLYLWYLSM